MGHQKVTIIKEGGRKSWNFPGYIRFWWGRGDLTILNRVVREGLFEKMILEQMT